VITRRSPQVDLAGLQSDLPLLTALGRISRVLIRWRWLVVPVVGLAFYASRGALPGDLPQFSRYGRQILTGNLTGSYSKPYDQSGPLQLLAAATAPPWMLRNAFRLTVLTAVWSVFVSFGSMWFVRLVRGGAGLARSGGLELAAGLLTAAWLIGGQALGGHLAELTIPASWVLAGLAIRRGHWALAGALLGTSVAWEPWGVLGMPVALLALNFRDAARATATALGIATACYLPFIVAGPFRMLEFQWGIGPSTLVHTLWPHATSFGWLPRLVQGSLCIGVGSAIAVSLRRQRTANAAWLVPVAILLVRFVFDPMQTSYYWVGAQVALLAGIALIDVRKRLSAVLVVTCLLVTSAAFGGWKTDESLGGLALVVVLTALERREARRAGHPYRLPTSGGQPVVDRKVGDVDADHGLTKTA
jgi:hypothetical protein